MFRGSSPTKIDDKGRLKIPTDFRRILEERFGQQDLFVTSFKGDSALLYPLPVWEELEERLRAVPSTEKAKSKYMARASYFGQQVKIDVQGRLLIPQILRESAGMTGDVVVMGELDHLVVWNHERFLKLLEEEPLTDEDFRALTQYGI
jgi:MraZ protein